MSATERIIADARLQLLPSDANRYATIFGVVGLAGLGYTALGFFDDASKADALMSYLVAYIYGMTILVGCMFFATLQHVVGARWSTTLRRLAENIGAVTPILAVLFLPLLWGMSTLWSWANGQPQPADVMAKAGYLNTQFFIIRAVFYLVTWAVIGTWFYRQSVAQDKSGDPMLTKSMRTASTIAVILFGVTLSFAGFDWVMSLDPTWASTMFGVYTFAGSMISSLCTIGLAAHLLQRAGYLKGVITVENYHDLGKLIFGFIVFWAYIAFSQFMLIWYANLPEETAWFRMRWENGWSTLAVALCILHFAVPFFAMLSRTAKRNAMAMMSVAVLILVMHYVDLFWVIMPVRRHSFEVSARDIAALLGVCGLCLAGIFNRMGAAALIPVKDPYVHSSLEYDNG